MRRKLMLRNKSMYKEGMTTVGRTEMGRNSMHKTQLFACVTQNSSAGPERCPETQEDS